METRKSDIGNVVVNCEYRRAFCIYSDIFSFMFIAFCKQRRYVFLALGVMRTFTVTKDVAVRWYSRQ